jgi:putative acetyltransferase
MMAASKVESDQAPQPAPLRIEPLREDHFERLHDVFDAVCREKRFLAFTHAGPREETFAYYRRILDGGETHVVALDGDRLVGWCDVLGQIAHARRHVGTLGMAVATSHRGRGVGRALIEAAIARATGRGLTRIELTVRADNVVAQRLYRSVGFVVEGTQVRGWCVEGQCFDLVAMARLGDG